MKKKQSLHDEKFVLVSCMYTAPGVVHPSPGSTYQCVDCKKDVHLSHATNRDVTEKGMFAVPICFPCIALKIKSNPDMEDGGVGKHTMFALLQAIKNKNN